MPVIVAWAYGLRTKATCTMPGELEIVDVDRGTGDQPRVFLALDRRADIAAQNHFALLIRGPRPTADADLLLPEPSVSAERSQSAISSSILEVRARAHARGADCLFAHPLITGGFLRILSGGMLRI